MQTPYVCVSVGGRINIIIASYSSLRTSARDCYHAYSYIAMCHYEVATYVNTVAKDTVPLIQMYIKQLNYSYIFI